MCLILLENCKLTMDNILMRRMNPRSICLIFNLRLNHTLPEPKYPTSKRNILDKGKKIHPYCKIHPWRSQTQFCSSMLEKVLYNEDGLVAINKPYGISARVRGPDDKFKPAKHPSGIPNEVHYTINDVLPMIADHLGHESLQIVKAPEKFTSGVVLLAASEKVKKSVEKSLRIAESDKIIPRTYWTVARAIPRELQGEHRVAMTLNRTKEQPRPVPIIVNKWSENAHKRRDIKILNVQYKILSHATENLASLLEIKSSTTQWHAVRLFASTILFSPILGDRIYGSRVQNVMGKWVLVSPVVDAAHMPPKLDPQLLTILDIEKRNADMIPVHMHLREVYLPCFLKKQNNVSITAPLFPEFLWTYSQLKFDDKLIKHDTNAYAPSVECQEVT